MVHLVYCDDKSKELAKILDGSKTMVIRGAAGREKRLAWIIDRLNKNLKPMQKSSC